MLAKHESIQDAIPQELKIQLNDGAGETSNSHRALVESRLLSSKVLAQEIAEVALSLRKLIDPTLGEASTSKSKSKTAINTEGEGDTSTKRIAPKRQDTSERDVESARSDGSDDEDEEEILDAMEASGSGLSEVEDDGGWESGSIDDDPRNSEPEDEEASSDEDAGSADEDTSPKPARSKKSTKVSANTKLKSTPASAAESKFLPSLSVGFTRGDSDSDWSDGEAGLADGPKKKNRRGQRARKA